MAKTSFSAFGLYLGSICVIVSWADSSHAQSFGSGLSSSALTSYDFSGADSYFRGSPTYVPFSSSMGGFLPYTPGPRGGLGVQSGMRNPGAPMQSGGMGMLGLRPSLDPIRGELTPLAPIHLDSLGFKSGGGMGSMRGLIRRAPSYGSMGGMTRPPVGNYPFRQPPSLLGPASAAPSMSM
jgi:hypothetical protein